MVSHNGNGETPKTKHQVTSKKAYRLLSSTLEEIDILNQLWGVQHSAATSKRWWSNLWGLDLSFFAKVILSWLINHENYTKIKVVLLKHSNGRCKLCVDQEESSYYIFCTCSFAIECWTTLTQTLSKAESQRSLQSMSSLLDVLDDYFHNSSTHTIRLIIFFETVWFI